MLSVVTVDTPLDLVDFTDGVTSLREAIFATNLVGGPDEIEFDFGHDGPETILLSQGELALTDDLTIHGPGADLLTIDASGNDPTPASKYDDDTVADDGDGSRIFVIDDGDFNTLIDVSISGLTLTGGDPVGQGGAIHSLENLTITQSMIVENSAPQGAGISSGHFRYGSLEIRPTLSVTDSVVSGNTARGEGGGIYGYGMLSVRDSVVSGNWAGDKGGGIFGGIATLLLTDSVISDNTARGEGGGISIGYSATINHNSILRNQARKGGGIYTRGSSIISDNSISANMAENSGGGLFVRANDKNRAATISRNAFLNNSAGNDGGGIKINISRDGRTLVTENTISGNTAGDDGGGIASRNSRDGLVTITDSILENNRSTGSGGGIFAVRHLTINNSTISRNTASEEGGGIGATTIGGDLNSSLTVVNSTIQDNSVTSSGVEGEEVRGGGISVGMLTITDSTITGNAAVISGASSRSAKGGGIFSPILTIVDSTVSNNVANGPGHAFGGGIYGSRELTINGSTISGNAAEGDGAMGGGIYAPYSLNAVASTISGNRTDHSGGGIYATGALAIASSTISGNRADHSGGGIYFGQLSSAPNAEAAIAHSTITLNQAGTGGGIFVRSGPLNLDHAIVARNSAGAGRDLTGLLGAQINPRFSLIGDNTDSGLAEAPIGSPDADGNLIGQLAFPGQGGINPYLGPLADNGGSTHTHGLLLGSVAIGAGDPAAVGGSNGVPEFDQRGAPFGRVVDGPIDMGAFEGQPASGSFDGDFNTDDDIDGHDFLTWQRGFGTTVNTVKADGDATGNGAVDANDLAVWQSTFGSAVTVALSVDRFQLSDPDFQFPFWTVGRAGDERPEIVFLKDSIIDDRRADRVDPVSTTARAHGAAVSSRAHRELLPSITRRTHDRLSSAHPKMEPDGQGILLALDKFFALLGG